MIRRLIVSTLSSRSFRTTAHSSDFHFDTHHFVQRLEREGLKREQAEGIMSAMAEVIDESIRNMTANMVTKADQEKVDVFATQIFTAVRSRLLATLHTAGRLCPNKIRAAIDGKERPRNDQSRA